MLCLTHLAAPNTQPARASVTGCQGSIAPTTVAANTASDFELQLTNNDPSSNIAWVEIDTPSGYYPAVNSASAPGWTATVDSNNYVVLTGGTIVPGDTLMVTLNATTFYGETPGTFWYTHISDDPSGQNSSLCDGDFTTAITNDVPPPVISDVNLTKLTPHGVTISWSTDVQTLGSISFNSPVDGGGKADQNSAGWHQVTLSDLTANTLYHFVISADDQKGNVVTSPDNTFLTPLEPPPAPPPIIVNNITVNETTVVAPNVPNVTILPTPTEHEPPVVTLSTALDQPLKSPPTVTGIATDNDAVARVEYSTDGGQNWLPVDKITPTPRGVRTGPGSVTYSFTPPHLEDGNYSLVVRATDASGNSSQTAPTTFVIDRLAPQVGVVTLAFGPQLLEPDQTGLYQVVAGADYRMSASAVGGPTSMAVEAVRATTPELALQTSTTGPHPAPASFGFAADADSGLWNGVMHLSDSGRYQLVARSLDGAGNRTARVIATVTAASPGLVVHQSNMQPVAGANIKVFVHEPTSGVWTLWQSRPYGQATPQTSAKNGRYSIMLPAGEYYMTAAASGLAAYTSHIFQIQQPTVINAKLSLAAPAQIHLGPIHLSLPAWPWQSQPLSLSTSTVAAKANPLIGRSIPDFALSDLSGATQNNFTFTGKPTVLSFVNTWSPTAQDQLKALAEAQANPEVNVVPIFVQQSAGEASAYIATAGYQLHGLADPDGTLVDKLGLGAAPEHIFIDRQGTIKTLMVKVLSSQDLLNQLGGL